jgi:uncharacterized membrane protein
MEEPRTPPPHRTFWGTLWRQFFTGILTVIPLAATLFLLIWVFRTIDDLMEPIVTLIAGRPIPGVGFVATILLIYIAGVIASNILGKRLIGWGEALIGRIPVIKQLYGGVRDITNSLTQAGKEPFLKVVLVEWPSPGMKTLAFITREANDKNGRKLLNVLIPSVPNPATGYLAIMREEDVIATDISVNDALKLLLSLGKVSPQEIEEKLAEADDKRRSQSD